MSSENLPTFAIITPSYYRDFEYCKLLAESVLRHTPAHVHHYILVDRRDRDLFSALVSPRTHLVLKEDILPRWLWQIPFWRRWWLSARSLPVRGWMVQQLAKLSVNRAVPADVYVFLDSGAFFVRDFDPRATMKDGKVPLFREQKEEVRVPWNTRWHQISARMLGLPEQSSYDTSYVGNLVYWRKANLDALQRRIETITGRPWCLALSRHLTMSEYVLYGMFAEHVMKEDSGQYFYPVMNSLSYWDDAHLDERGLRAFKEQLGEGDVVVMLNEKARIDADLIRRVFVTG